MRCVCPCEKPGLEALEDGVEESHDGGDLTLAEVMGEPRVEAGKDRPGRHRLGQSFGRGEKMDGAAVLFGALAPDEAGILHAPDERGDGGGIDAEAFAHLLEKGAGTLLEDEKHAELCRGDAESLLVGGVDGLEQAVLRQRHQMKETRLLRHRDRLVENASPMKRRRRAALAAQYGTGRVTRTGTPSRRSSARWIVYQSSRGASRPAALLTSTSALTA